MYSVEQLRNASAFSQLIIKQGKELHGVLSTEQATQKALLENRVICIGSMVRGVFFFSDDHCFGYPIIPKDFVACSSSFPMDVVPRKGLESGIVATLEDYVKIFQKDRKQITSIEELVDLLNKE